MGMAVMGFVTHTTGMQTALLARNSAANAMATKVCDIGSGMTETKVANATPNAMAWGVSSACKILSRTNLRARSIYRATNAVSLISFAEQADHTPSCPSLTAGTTEV